MHESTRPDGARWGRRRHESTCIGRGMNKPTTVGLRRGKPRLGGKWPRGLTIRYMPPGHIASLGAGCVSPYLGAWLSKWRPRTRWGRWWDKCWAIASWHKAHSVVPTMATVNTHSPCRTTAIHALSATAHPRIHTRPIVVGSLGWRRWCLEHCILLHSRSNRITTIQ